MPLHTNAAQRVNSPSVIARPPTISIHLPIQTCRSSPNFMGLCPNRPKRVCDPDSRRSPPETIRSTAYIRSANGERTVFSIGRLLKNALLTPNDFVLSRDSVSFGGVY